jgi:hypothetical protein
MLSFFVHPCYLILSLVPSFGPTFSSSPGMSGSINPMASFAEAVATCCSYLCVPLVQLLACMHSILCALLRALFYSFALR